MNLKKRKSRRLYVGALCILCMATLCGCSRKTEYSKTGTMMDTVFTFHLYSLVLKENPCDRLFQMGEDLEKQISWRIDTSEMADINQNAGKENGTLLSEQMEDWLTLCFEVSEKSEGAFDITLGEVSRLWNIETLSPETFILPDTEQLAGALSSAGFSKVRMFGNPSQIVIPEGMQLDLGAVGKGIFLQLAAQEFEEKTAVRGAVITAGGSVYVYGEKPDGSAFHVGIVNPEDTGSTWGILELPGGYFVSTSGDYERFVEKDGVRYHHILDPKTGSPANSGVKSVTIVIASSSHPQAGLLSDALSTACFVLGPEEGMELAKEYGAEVLYICSDGSSPMSEGMEKILRK